LVTEVNTVGVGRGGKMQGSNNQDPLLFRHFWHIPDILPWDQNMQEGVKPVKTGRN